jgi:membrane protein YdbS with pleckstrin-like domain
MRLRRTGTEPLAARSPYGLRRVLAAIAAVGGLLGAVAFTVLALRPDGRAEGEWIAAGICLVTVVIAIVDLLVLRRRP